MWILVWLSFMDGQFEYYQLGSFGTEAHCNRAKDQGRGIWLKYRGSACFSVDGTDVAGVWAVVKLTGMLSNRDLLSVC